MAEDIGIIVARWSRSWYIFRVLLTAAAMTLAGGAILLAHDCVDTPSRRPRHWGILRGQVARRTNDAMLHM